MPSFVATSRTTRLGHSNSTMYLARYSTLKRITRESRELTRMKVDQIRERIVERK